MLSLTAWGRLGPAGPLTRSGGRPGDGLWVHGAVGRSAVGLARWLATPHPAGWAAPGAAEPADPCLRAHLRPAPDLRAGPAALAAGASAGMDLSDGLAVDLERLARASRVSLVVDLARLPADEALVDVPADVRVAGGEDYGLVVLAPEGAAAALAAAGFVAMGRAEAPAGPLVRFTEGDQAVTLAGVPFDHFGVGAGGP
jgi:thiamine-monophosphate kinase